MINKSTQSPHYPVNRCLFWIFVIYMLNELRFFPLNSKIKFEELHHEKICRFFKTAYFFRMKEFMRMKYGYTKEPN